MFLLENRSRGGGIVAWRGKGGGMNSFVYITLLGYHSRGGSTDSAPPPPPPPPPPKRNPSYISFFVIHVYMEEDLCRGGLYTSLLCSIIPLVSLLFELIYVQVNTAITVVLAMTTFVCKLARPAVIASYDPMAF